MKMYEMNYFSLFCKSYLVVFLIFISGTMILCWTTTHLRIFLYCSKYFWSCICESLVLMITFPLLNNIHHRAIITPIIPLCLVIRLIHIINMSCWTICRSFKIILEMGTVHWIGLQIQCSIPGVTNVVPVGTKSPARTM